MIFNPFTHFRQRKMKKLHDAFLKTRRERLDEAALQDRLRCEEYHRRAAAHHKASVKPAPPENTATTTYVLPEVHIPPSLLEPPVCPACHGKGGSYDDGDPT